MTTLAAIKAACVDHLKSPVDPRTLRDTAGHFATGVTVMTTRDASGAPVGMVVNSFSCLSLDPPLIMWGIDRKTASLAAFTQNDGFAVNIMGAQAAEETMRFAKPLDDKFVGSDWTLGLYDAPVLSSAIATMECRMHERLPGGDHEILIGQVERCTSRSGEPLLFHRGRLARIGDAL